MVGCIKNMTTNGTVNYLIDKVMNMTINDARNDLIGCVANLIINDTRRNLNRANMSGVQVQFADDRAGKNHQNLLSSQMIGIQHEEIPVLASLTEPSIGTKNKTELTISTGVVQAPQACKSPKMEEVIAIMTAYNTGVNQNPQRTIRTGVGGYTPVTSINRAVDGGSVMSDVCTSPPPCAPPPELWDSSIGNIRKTTDPNLRYTKKLNSPIARILCAVCQQSDTQ